jgi:membrane protease YdiL (CAAX protease family)
MAPLLETLLLALCVNLVLPKIKYGSEKSVYVYSRLFIIALGFGVIHFKATLFGFAVVTISFLLYGALYYFSDRNMVPPIIAHAVWNALLFTM